MSPSVIEALAVVTLFHVLTWFIGNCIGFHALHKYGGERGKAVYRVVAPVYNLIRWSIIVSFLQFLGAVSASHALHFTPIEILGFAVFMAAFEPIPPFSDRLLSCLSWKDLGWVLSLPLLYIIVHLLEPRIGNRYLVLYPSLLIVLLLYYAVNISRHREEIRDLFSSIMYRHLSVLIDKMGPLASIFLFKVAVNTLYLLLFVYVFLSALFDYIIYITKSNAYPSPAMYIAFLCYTVFLIGFLHINVAKYYLLDESNREREVPSPNAYRPSIAVYIAAVLSLGILLSLNIIITLLLTQNILNIDLYKSISNTGYQILAYATTLTVVSIFVSILYEFMVYINIIVESRELRFNKLALIHPSMTSAVFLHFLEGCAPSYKCLSTVMMRLLVIPITALFGFAITSLIGEAGGEASSTTIKLVWVIWESILVPLSVYVLGALLRKLSIPCRNISDAIGRYINEVHLRTPNMFTIVGQGLPARILAHRLVTIWQRHVEAEAPHLFAPFTAKSGLLAESLECGVRRAILVSSITVLDKDDRRHSWCGTSSPDKRYSLCYTLIDESDTHVIADNTGLVTKTLDFRFPTYMTKGKYMVLPSVKGDATLPGLWSAIRPPALLIIMIPHYEAMLNTLRSYLSSIAIHENPEGDSLLIFLSRTNTATFSLFYAERRAYGKSVGAMYPLDHLYAHMFAAAFARWLYEA